jgi:hypothetical protein
VENSKFEKPPQMKKKPSEHFGAGKNCRKHETIRQFFAAVKISR